MKINVKTLIAGAVAVLAIVFLSLLGKIGEDVKLLLDPVKLLSDDALCFIDKQEAEEEE